MDVDHKNIHGERLGKKQHFLINGQNACNSLVVNWYFINEKDVLTGLGKMISIHYIYLKVCLPHLHIEADWTKLWRGLTILISVTFSLHVQDIRVVISFWSNFFSRDYKLKEIVFKKVIFHNFQEMMSLSFHIDIKIIRNYSQILVIVLSWWFKKWITVSSTWLHILLWWSIGQMVGQSCCDVFGIFELFELTGPAQMSKWPLSLLQTTHTKLG